MNICVFSTSNNFSSYHRKREVESLYDELSLNSGKLLYFNKPKFLFKKEARLNVTANFPVIDLYTLCPISIAIRFKILLFLLVTIPLKVQVAFYLRKNGLIGKVFYWFYKPDQYLYLPKDHPYVYVNYDNYKLDANYYFSKSIEFGNTLANCIHRSSLALFSSNKLKSELSFGKVKHVKYYPNAISSSLLKGDEIDKKSTKTIGFVGHLDSSFDAKLLKYLSTNLKEYKFVLIGPVSSPEIEMIVNSSHNVSSLGYIKYDLLAKEIAKFDVGICPYLPNEFNQYRNPLKIYEYFALGIPVVTTDCDLDPEVLSFISVAAGNTQFLKALKKELESDNEELIQKRKLIAADNTWSARAKMVIDFLKETE